MIMDQEKLITFAVPCYNSAAYMEHCVDTLLQGGDALLFLRPSGSRNSARRGICPLM